MQVDFPKWLERLNDIPKGRSFRHFERRLFIKTDLWLKTRYARLIGRGVQTPDENELEAVIMAPNGQLLLATMPRYQDFDDAAMKYAESCQFVEIAGNKVICLSVLALKNTRLPNCVKRLYSIGWLPNRTFERGVVELPVTNLAYFLNFLKQNRHITLEKIYDY